VPAYPASYLINPAGKIGGARLASTLTILSSFASSWQSWELDEREESSVHHQNKRPTFPSSTAMLR
jgi:hypothetical protein